MKYLINEKYSKCNYPTSEQSLLVLGFTYVFSGNKNNIEILPLLYYTLKKFFIKLYSNFIFKKNFSSSY